MLVGNLEVSITIFRDVSGERKGKQKVGLVS